MNERTAVTVAPHNGLPGIRQRIEREARRAGPMHERALSRGRVSEAGDPRSAGAGRHLPPSARVHRRMHEAWMRSLAQASAASDYLAYEEAEESDMWHTLDAPATPLYPWDPASTYIRRPPFAAVAVELRVGHYRRALPRRKRAGSVAGR